MDKLYIIHLRNKIRKDGSFDHISELIPVNRISSEICQDLLDCDLRGEKWQNPLCDVPEYVSTHEAEIRELIQTKTAAEERLTEIKAQVLSIMEAQDIKSLTTDTGLKLTRKLPTQRSSFDFNAFKADHPDDYSPYMKVSEIAGSLSIAI